MANRYIRHGATFNGDGTSPELATSNGGPGAWNTLTYFEGVTPAYGVLAAGDRVYVRTKDASGADISLTRSSEFNLGSTAATESAPINWVFDNGTVWPGVSGVVTYTQTANANVFAKSNNHIHCRAKFNLRAIFTATNTGACFSFGSSTLSGVLIDISASEAFGCVFFANEDRTRPKIIGCLIRIGKLNWGNAGIGIATNPGLAIVYMQDTWVELTKISPNESAIKNATTVARFVIRGGGVFGVGATSGSMYVAYASSLIDAIGFTFPNVMGIDPYPFTVEYALNNRFSAYGTDGASGSLIADYWGSADSRNDGNYPTLSAFYPDAEATPWSWKLWPNRAKPNAPAELTMTKRYLGAEATATITVRLNYSTTFDAAYTDLTYITVAYVNSVTGKSEMITSATLDRAPLPESSAEWSLPSYGAISLNKREVSVETPAAIKSNSDILVTLFVAKAGLSVNEIMFVCPDFVVA